ALLSVLWGVALLAIIATSFLSTGHVSHRFARNTIEAARTDVLAEAAVSRAALALLDPRPARRWRVDGRLQDFSFDGARMHVGIQDELGRIDLNQADESLLLGLFASVGLETQTTRALVDKILDWRSANGTKHLNGAN